MDPQRKPLTRIMTPVQVAELMVEFDPNGHWNSTKVWAMARKFQFPQPIMFSKKRGGWKDHEIEAHIEALKSGDGVPYYGSIPETAPVTMMQPMIAPQQPQQPVHHSPMVSPHTRNVYKMSPPQEGKYAPKGDIIIKDDLPIPQPRTWGPHNSPFGRNITPLWQQYKFDQMEVGKYIEFDLIDGGEAKRAVVMNSAKNYGKKTNKVFRSSRISDEKWGLWRVA